MKQVGVFVNVSNQFYSVGSSYQGRKVNYEEYLKAAVGDDSLYRAFAYGVQLDDEAREFIAALREHGYEPKYKKARKFLGPKGLRPDIRNTDWNIGMAMDVVRVLDRLDIVVIGSNDQNLVPLIHYCKERGKKVVVFTCNVGRELRDAADAVLEIQPDHLDRKEAKCSKH